MANGSLGGAAGSRAVYIFITGHREFPEQEINTSSLFIVAGSWWLMAAEFKPAFSLLLAQPMVMWSQALCKGHLCYTW